MLFEGTGGLLRRIRYKASMEKPYNFHQWLDDLVKTQNVAASQSSLFVEQKKPDISPHKIPGFFLLLRMSCSFKQEYI